MPPLYFLQCRYLNCINYCVSFLYFLYLTKVERRQGTMPNILVYNILYTLQNNIIMVSKGFVTNHNPIVMAV